MTQLMARVDCKTKRYCVCGAAQDIIIYSCIVAENRLAIHCARAVNKSRTHYIHKVRVRIVVHRDQSRSGRAMVHRVVVRLIERARRWKFRTFVRLLHIISQLRAHKRTPDPEPICGECVRFCVCMCGEPLCLFGRFEYTADLYFVGSALPYADPPERRLRHRLGTTIRQYASFRRSGTKHHRSKGSVIYSVGFSAWNACDGWKSVYCYLQKVLWRVVVVWQYIYI